MEEIITRQERLKRRNKANRKRKTIFTLFVCLVAIFVIIWISGSVKGLVNWHTMQLVPATYGVLEDATEKEAVIIRKESSFTVPQPENVEFMVKEAERVHTGELLFKINSSAIDRTGKGTDYKLYAPCAGTVSMKVDGLETVLTPGNIFSLNLQSVYDEVTKGTMEGQGEKGKSAVKIVDNLSPVYLCFPDPKLELKKDSQVRFRVPGSQELFSGKIMNEPRDIVVARIASVPKELVVKRVCSIQVITRRESGLIVPTTSLVEKDGETGLYAVSGKNVHWTVVSVKGVFKEKAVVNGIDPGQEIVANPETI